MIHMKLSRYRQSVFALSRGINKRLDYVGRSKIAVRLDKLTPKPWRKRDLARGAIRGGIYNIRVYNGDIGASRKI